MERIIYLFLLIFLLDSSDSYRDVTCPKNETIGQQNTVDVLQLGDHAWTVVIEIKTYQSEFDEFQPEGKINKFYCSGSLLKPFLVLTSASCLNTHVSRKRKSETIGVFVFGDYNRSEIAEFMKVPKKYPTDGRRDPQDTEYYCQISAKHQPRTYKKRYIYYYDYAKRYKKSDPDIAFIGLNESIIFNSTSKISVPIARPCHEIDYDNCLITQLKDRDRGHFEYKCEVTFEDKEINDGFMEHSYQKKFGKLDCSPKTSERTTYFGGNPIVCRLKKSDPEKYVQIGILQLKGSDYKYIYLPDIINL